MKDLSKYCFVLTLLTASGCQHNPAKNEGKVSSASAFYGTEIFLSPCQTMPKRRVGQRVASELTGAIALELVKTGISYVSSSLKKAASDDIIETTVFTNLISVDEVVQKDAPARGFNCIQIVRSSFELVDDSYEPADGDRVLRKGKGVESLGYYVSNYKTKKDSEDLFVELLPLSSGDVLAFAPLKVKYKKSGNKNTDLGVMIGLATNDKDVTVGEFSGRVISFGSIPLKKDETYEIDFTSKEKHLSLRLMTQWISVPKASDAKELVIAAKVIETKKAGQLPKILSSAFELSKEEISTKLQQNISDSELFQSKEQSVQKELELQQSRLDSEKLFNDSRGAALVKEESLNALCAQKEPLPTESQIYLSQTELLYSQKMVNLKAETLGYELVYSSEELKVPTGSCL